MIIAMALMALTFAPASAQDVLNEIVKTSLATVNDTTKSLEVRKTAVFKYDAMTYLRSKFNMSLSIRSVFLRPKRRTEMLSQTCSSRLLAIISCSMILIQR